MISPAEKDLSSDAATIPARTFSSRFFLTLLTFSKNVICSWGVKSSGIGDSPSATSCASTSRSQRSSGEVEVEVFLGCLGNYFSIVDSGMWTSVARPDRTKMEGSESVREGYEQVRNNHW